ncbi:uncharacterized protein C8R40DRAFT_1106387 [Lentinula edodes]|uniref:uncharacterized protein n=1 Tax=Lentinula edodes TaxID=5353 RepID=UPI001E8E9539|nr:uncharacterized protein C8R40DRAFT_1106387 [Lentinula edodes]KAH7874960.1 hypothetical protein C8R40DRAFT_1106387 [Lentinula edodes]
MHSPGETTGGNEGKRRFLAWRIISFCTGLCKRSIRLYSSPGKSRQSQSFSSCLVERFKFL